MRRRRRRRGWVGWQIERTVLYRKRKATAHNQLVTSSLTTTLHPSLYCIWSWWWCGEKDYITRTPTGIMCGFPECTRLFPWFSRGLYFNPSKQGRNSFSLGFSVTVLYNLPCLLSTCNTCHGAAALLYSLSTDL